MLQVLNTFSDRERVVISYLGIMRYAGIGSFSTIRAAIEKFQKMHLLEGSPFGAAAAATFAPVMNINSRWMIQTSKDWQLMYIIATARKLTPSDGSSNAKNARRTPYQDNSHNSHTALLPDPHRSLLKSKYCLQKL